MVEDEAEERGCDRDFEPDVDGDKDTDVDAKGVGVGLREAIGVAELNAGSVVGSMMESESRSVDQEKKGGGDTISPV